MLRRYFHILIKIFVVLTFALPTPFVHAQFLFHQKKETAAQLQDQQLEQMKAQMSHSTDADADSDDALKSASIQPAIVAKKPGTVRIGIVMPTNNLEGKGKTQDGEPLRQAMKELLAGPSLETVPIKAILPEQALEEAKLLDCDYILTSTISQQQTEGQGRFSKFGGMRTLQMAASAAQFVPGIGATAMMANAALTTVASQATTQSLTSVSSSIKANSEITLTYSLVAVAGTNQLTDKVTARSKSDGDDVITAMLTSSAQKIATNLKK